MGAIAVAMLVGLFAVGLVAALTVMATLVIAGARVLNAAHDGSNWVVDHWRGRTH